LQRGDVANPQTLQKECRYRDLAPIFASILLPTGGRVMKAVQQNAGIRLRVRELSSSIAEVLAGTREAARRQALKGVRPAILSASGGAMLGAALAVAPSAPLWAQADRSIDEITVTGSRIRRQDFTANSPITTVDEATFRETTAIGVETILNQLPQFTPAVTQFSTFDTENTATNTVGASTVSLRGLGPNRNLVLINGRRPMPVNPTMVVDTNSIPSSAISRVEVISGGASAVYGADAVGGVVNFILKDNFEGASVDVRLGDTQHGGNQEITVSALIGANLAADRGNVMLGVERATRSAQFLWERDWRVADYANPRTGGTEFFPTETWFSNPVGQGIFGNLPDQDLVNSMFSSAQPCTPNAIPGFAGACPVDGNGSTLGVSNSQRFYVNRTPDGSGTVFTGLNFPTGAAGTYRYNGPFDVDQYGKFAGLPFRVEQPDGAIKENTWYNMASIPLERLSGFAMGHFDVSENVRVTAQVMVTRTENRTSMGDTSDTIGVWGAEIPFGSEIYLPSVTNLGADGLPNTGDAGEDMTTLPAFTAGGIYQLNCPTVGGCTETEAWPVPPEVQTLMESRPDPNMNLWVNRTQDALRFLLGDARGSTNKTTTMQFSLGAEGELPSGNHFWDVTLSTGRTDVQNTLVGSIRLTSYRQLIASPNYGVAFVGDPNPASVGFAEGIPTCTTGMPIVRDFLPSEDCVKMLHAPLQNQTDVTQTVVEANLVGNLAEMRAGPLAYALGATRRENGYEYLPDNLLQNNSLAETVAGTFPNTDSRGEFDVSELYGELLIPLISNGPRGVEHLNLELGGRISDWSMPQVNDLQSYKALIDWAITPRYRVRGGFNRAHRAPNLGELFIGRSQRFASLPYVFGDQCSQNHQQGPFSANPAVAGPEQAAQTEAICRALMGPTGAFEYYDNRPVTDQPDGLGFFSNPGTQNTSGNLNVSEEKADTLTLGVVMGFLENWTLTVDYYQIEIDDMIALASPDSVFETCLSVARNPTGSPNAPACQQITRNPFSGGAANIDLSFTNQGRAKVSGVDLQLNWARMFGSGGLNLNMVANYNLKSETQDRPDLNTIDWAGTSGCGLQIQCQGYDYRMFTTASYMKGPWSVTLRHQFWPSILDASFADGVGATPNPLGNVEAYQLFYLGGSYSFGDKYTLRFGIENLFDKDPPFTGGNPNSARFPTPPQRVISRGLLDFGQGGSAVYDPLGRRGFISMTMDF
jgi:iron complex outermembrane recepter protein